MQLSYNLWSIMKKINGTEEILMSCKILWVQARVKYPCISDHIKERMFTAMLL